MGLATEEAIRDRVIALIEAIAPTSPAAPAFRRYRNEGKGNFRAFAESEPTGALRRFQVRDRGDDGVPAVTNMDFDRRELVLEVTVAYPQNSRTGSDGALDRDDAMNADWKKIEYAISIYGRANFSAGHDCTPTGATKSIDRDGLVDFLVIVARFEYFRSVP